MRIECKALYALLRAAKTRGQVRRLIAALEGK